jgi:hypothetical protein
LCTALEGRPVASLDEEVKQIRYAATIGALIVLGGRLPDVLPSLMGPAPTKAARAEISRELLSLILPFISCLNRESGMAVDAELVADSVFRGLEAVAGTASLKGRNEGMQELRATLENLAGMHGSFNSLFLALFLLFDTIGTTEGETTEPDRLLTDLGLYRALSAICEAAGQRSSGLAPPWGVDGAVLLMKILLTERLEQAPDDVLQESHRAATLLRNHDVRKFIQVHHSEGIEWFNRERYEDLSGWLFLSAAAKALACAENRRGGTGLLLRLHESLMLLVKDAEKAGYRTDLLA